MFTVPAVSAFKAYFTRDFKYAPANDADNQSFVTDADISKAYSQAFANFNDSLFPDESVEMVFLHLSAFYLVHDLQHGALGVNSQVKFPVASKSVDGVAVSYAVPEAYAKDPYLSFFTGNGYGIKYLSYLIPKLVGNIASIEGDTTP